MSAIGVGKLHLINGTVNTETYLNILEKSLQGGAACHKSKNALKWFSENNISLLEWVSSSPDLSPIETPWHEMKKQLRADPARTVAELKERLQEIWDNFSPEY
nr:unnamed protein product [Callosobruchus analis]